jgi:hypothetical protein
MNNMGRKLGPEGKRIRMPNIIVSQSTIMHLNAWRSCYGVPYGRIVDALMLAAVNDGSFKLSTAGKRKSLISNLPDKQQQQVE